MCYSAPPPTEPQTSVFHLYHQIRLAAGAVNLAVATTMSFNVIGRPALAAVEFLPRPRADSGDIGLDLFQSAIQLAIGGAIGRDLLSPGASVLPR
jgi:hypothetical protein